MNELFINGGKPLPGCPTSFEEADKWAAGANRNSKGGPRWGFDCGFKLEFDGELLSISSKFYPPKEGYGPGWDGKVELFLMGQLIGSKSFATVTLDELKAEVEEYTQCLVNRLKTAVGLTLS
jgi:hypothetical protein